MVSWPMPLPPNTPCPDCRRQRMKGDEHCKKGAPDSKCVVPGCKKRPLVECFVGGERVAVWCLVDGHRWRKPL